MKTALVIGAGIGGIAISARLAKNGFKVTVFEKNDTPGGRFNKIERHGFRFDTGPTLFLMPEIFAETYSSLGEKMEDHLDLIRLDPTYRVYLHDNTIVDLTSDINDMRVQLDSIEHGSFPAYLRFLSEGYRHYNLSLKHFVGRNFINFFQFFNPKNIPLIFKLKALTTHYKNLTHYFKDSRLRALFSFQNMYLGLSPYKALATYSLLQYTELAEGVWFPRGGMYKVIETLVKIAENLGVQFKYGTSVEKINIDGSRASGITLSDGEKINADLIIANADLPYVYSKLLPDNTMSKKLNKKKYTSSALMFYWSVKGERSKKLLHHNVFLADNKYEESFKSIFNDLTLPEEPSFYVCAPTRTDPSFAPSDGDSLLILVPVGHISDERPQNWDYLRKYAKEYVLSKLSDLGINISPENIIYEDSIGPMDYLNSLNLSKGSAFGLSHNFMQVGYFRPHNRHPRYKNLYFVGASTHPGTGVPIVLISARLVMERILSEKWWI